MARSAFLVYNTDMTVDERKQKELMVAATICHSFSISTGIFIDPDFDYLAMARDIVDLFDEDAIIKEASQITKD